MKKQKIIYIIMLIIFITLNFLFSLFLYSNNSYFQDDFIFFKLFGKNNSQTTYEGENNIKLQNTASKKIYTFEVEYKNTNLKNINLVETIDNKTLINEKIAPGTKGEFALVITANEDVYYQVEFKSKNEKPRNLEFIVNGNNFKTLEEIQNILQGNINENEVKTITVKWEWKYENNSTQDIQDTKDGIHIKQYNFDICVTGI